MAGFDAALTCGVAGESGASFGPRGTRQSFCHTARDMTPQRLLASIKARAPGGRGIPHALIPFNFRSFASGVRSAGSLLQRQSMAGRSIWNGTLRSGKSSVAVKLYGAIEDEAVHFNLLHDAMASGSKQRMFNPKAGDACPTHEIYKGYEVDPAITSSTPHAASVLVPAPKAQTMACRSARGRARPERVQGRATSPRSPRSSAPEGKHRKHGYERDARLARRPFSLGAAGLLTRGARGAEDDLGGAAL